MGRDDVDPRINEITGAVVDSAFRVHRTLGPGLLEAPDRECLAREISKRGLVVEREKSFPVLYDGEALPFSYRPELVVERSVIVEVKAVEALLAVHEATTLAYVRIAGAPVGLLINFHVAQIRNGIRRYVGKQGERR